MYIYADEYVLVTRIYPLKYAYSVNMSVCMYVCMDAYMHVCMYVFMYVRIYGECVSYMHTYA